MTMHDKDIPVEALFSEGLSTTRRDFLKWCGISVSAAVLAACEKTPVKYALPYVRKPVELTPSIPNYYATSFFDGQIFQAVLAKVRDGRPIKIEGNPSYAPTQGGTHARGQASILSLYDHTRLQKPLLEGKPVDWAAVLDSIASELKAAAAAGQIIYLITPPILSPSLQALIEAWKKTYPTARHLVYEANPYDGLLSAHEAIFGKAVLPTYRLDAADVIVSFGADFLGTWLDPTTFSRAWAQKRMLYEGRNTLSFHIQFEAIPTITGLSADQRIPTEAAALPLAVISLYNHLAEKAGTSPINEVRWDTPEKAIALAADKLWEARGKSVVLSGSHLPAVQAVVAGINLLLGNYGQTLFVEPACHLRQAREEEWLNFLEEVEGGRVGVVLFHQVNPLYDAPEADRLQKALQKTSTTVAIHTHAHETAAACKYVLAESHYLESWGDAQPYAGLYTLQQPTIHTIFSTKSLAEILLAWLGRSESHLDYLRAFWEKEVYPAYVAYQKALQSGKVQPFWPQIESPLPTETAEAFWIRALEQGVVDMTTLPTTQPKAQWNPEKWTSALPTSTPESLTLQLYEKVTIGDGTQAGNPWLQEVPDPVSRVSWDNYALISPVLARQLGLKSNDVVTLALGEKQLTLPVYVLPGTAPNTIGVALGYGRTAGGRAAVGVGQNAYPFFGRKDAYRCFTHSGLTLTKTNQTYELARLQQWETYVGREYVREASLIDYQKDPKAGNHEEPHLISLWWKEHPMPGHQWGMVIDLTTCIGCASCVVACISENNIPVVGRDEIRRGRDMHWIRIDRYFTSTAEHTGKAEEFPAKPPEDFPRAFFMPMLCQHCNHAPCETVCPVLAIAHSSEGLNQQVYNRCVGTRYCANNCPYKVRRFNWFDYTNAENWVFNPVDELGRMVLNPDVTVRARGVMEKCSFCVQRIQAGKLEAKKEGRPLRDGEVKTACQQACPTSAIVFGDLNDPNSRVSKLVEEPRGYYALSELNVRPSIRYLVKIRNAEITQTQTA